MTPLPASSSVSSEPSVAAGTAGGKLRWLVIGLIFCATVINYIDRQTVSVLKTAISHDLG